VRYRRNDYSVPTTYGHRDVWCAVTSMTWSSHVGRVIARHPRSYEREDFVFDPLHYLALIEQKINALDQAAPLAGCSCRRFDAAASSGSARMRNDAALQPPVRGLTSC